MKKLLALLFIFCSFSSYSQDTIFLKNGTKIIPLAGFNKYYGTPLTCVGLDEESVSYAVPNSRWGRSVKYKDLDYAVIGQLKLECFEFKVKENSNKTRHLAYYVLIETENYKLLTISYSAKLIVPLCVNMVVDKNDVIIESASYFAGGTKNDQIKKRNVAVMIEKYFSNIKEEMSLLEECKLRKKYDDDSGISEYLTIHTYKKY